MAADTVLGNKPQPPAWKRIWSPVATAATGSTGQDTEPGAAESFAETGAGPVVAARAARAHIQPPIEGLPEV